MVRAMISTSLSTREAAGIIGVGGVVMWKNRKFEISKSKELF
jgi:hypothetical protein